MIFPDPYQLESIAAQLQVMDQDSHAMVYWGFNVEQQQLAQTICGPACNEINRTAVLKSRQIGTTTFFCLLDVVMCLLNPGIRAAIVVDTVQKAKDLLGRCRDFAVQLGIQLVIDNTTYIRFENGSQIQAITATGGKAADESKVARSQSFQLLHLSELPYWPNQSAYGSLLATSSGAPVWIETTAKGTGDLFWRLWTGQNEYRKIFFSVEQHIKYRRPATDITDELWEEAKRGGFSIRETAAWWFHELAAKGGEQDLIQHKHDYPIKPEDSFLLYKGRWIRTDPAIRKHTSQDGIKLFSKPQPQHSYTCAVDTSGGVGKDGNSVVVLDRTTRELMAYWKDNTATTDEVARKMATIDTIYHPDVFIVETNGIGRATLQAAKALGLPIRDVTTTESSKYSGLLMAKNWIENGVVYGPEELAEECGSLYCDPDGKFKGKKDSIMAIGFALREIDRFPLALPRFKNNQQVFNPEEWLAPKKGGMWG